MLEKNDICADDNKLDINSQHDCKGAAEFVGSFKGLKTSEVLPKGCYLRRGEVRFNRHPVGRRETESAPLCIMNGKFGSAWCCQ